MSDFYVIGAGINGLLLTRELAASGADVTLVDRQSAGMEASWAGGGIVSPLYPWRYSSAITALASWAQGFYPSLAQAIYHETGIDPELNQCGLIMLDADDEQEALEWGRECDRIVEQVNLHDIYQVEEGLGAGFNSALRMPQVANVRNPKLCRGLIASLQANKNVNLIENCSVRQIRRSRTGARSLLLSNVDKPLDVGASKVVICAGAWSRNLLQELGLTADVKPVKGQMLLYKFPAPPIKSILLTSGRYLIPRLDGHLLAGSTLEDSDFDKSVTEAARTALHQSAMTMLPELANMAPVGQWAGLRPGSSNGVPLIGAVPDFDNLYINAGQHRNGLVLAPASAMVMADILLDRKPVIAAEPYSPLGRVKRGS